MPLDLYRLPDSVGAKIRVLSHLHVVPLLVHDHLVLDCYLTFTGSLLLEVREVDGALARIQGVLKRLLGSAFFHLE